jgi:hypothetical protein
MGLGGAAGDKDALVGLFLTHTDDGHTVGLRWMTSESGRLYGPGVDALYASALYTSVKAAKHDAVKAAEALGLDHSTLSYGIRRVADTLATPEAGRDLINLYNQFTTKI